MAAVRNPLARKAYIRSRHCSSPTTAILAMSLSCSIKNLMSPQSPSGEGSRLTASNFGLHWSTGRSLGYCLAPSRKPPTIPLPPDRCREFPHSTNFASISGFGQRRRTIKVALVTKPWLFHHCHFTAETAQREATIARVWRSTLQAMQPWNGVSPDTARATRRGS